MIKTHAPLLSLLICVLAVRADGADSVWRGGTGDYSDPANWYPHGVPAVDTPVRITSGTVTFSESAQQPTSRGADTLVEDATLKIRGTFRNGFGHVAELKLDRGKIDHAGSFFVLAHSKPGRLVQNGGDISSTVKNAFYFSDHAGTPAVYEMNGGKLSIRYTEREDYQDIWNSLLGKASGDRWVINGGEVRIDGGNNWWTTQDGQRVMHTGIKRRLYIRRSSSVELNGGKLTFYNVERLSVGRMFPGEASVVVNGGGVFEVLKTQGESGGLVIGDYAEGRFELKGGTLNITVDEPQPDRCSGLVVGRKGGYGVFMQSAGTVNMSGLNVELAYGAGAIGRYEMSGGLLIAHDIILGGHGSTSGKFIFKGGEIQLDGDRRDLVKEDFFESEGSVDVNYDVSTGQTTLKIGI